MAEATVTCALIIILQMKKRRRRRRNRCLWTREWILQRERLSDCKHGAIRTAARGSDNKIYVSLAECDVTYHIAGFFHGRKLS